MSENRSSAIPKIRTFADDVAAAHALPTKTGGEPAPTDSNTPPTNTSAETSIPETKHSVTAKPVTANPIETDEVASDSNEIPPAATPVLPKADQTDNTFVAVDAGTIESEGGVKDIDEVVAGGEIIREKKRGKFRILPALGESLSGWFSHQAKELAKEPERETVEDPNKRVDTVTQATTGSALPGTDDFTSVSERINQQPRVRAEQTLTIKKADEMAAPQWSSQLDPATAAPTSTETEQPANQATAHTTAATTTKTADTSADHSTETDTAVQPPQTAGAGATAANPSPLPAAAATLTTETPTAPTKTVTDKTAPAPTTDPTPETVVPTPTPTETPATTAADSASANPPPPPKTGADATPANETPAPTSDADDTTQTSSEPETTTYQFRATPPEAPQRDWRSWLVIGAVAVAAIVFGITVSLYVVEYLRAPDRVLAPEVPSALTADRTVGVAVQQNGQALLRNMHETASAAGEGLLHLYPLLAEQTGATRPATPEETLSLVPLSADGSFVRNITGLTFISKGGNARGVVIEITSFETALGGMYRWENQIVRDLGDFLGTSPTASFTDTTSNNRDIRVATRGDGNELMYTFINRNTLLIATDRTLISEVVQRLQ